MRFSVLTIVLFAFLSSCKGPPAPLPTADFFVDGSGCTSPCKVRYYDQSLNAVSWEWDFGNGTTSVNQDDSAIYAAAGVYQVKLGVWNEDGIKDSIVKTVTVY